MGDRVVYCLLGPVDFMIGMSADRGTIVVRRRGQFDA